MASWTMGGTLPPSPRASGSRRREGRYVASVAPRQRLLSRRVRLAIIAVLAGAASVCATPALGVIRPNFRGDFMRTDGQVRCWLGPSFIQCVSMQTGRVAILHRNNRVETYFTSSPITSGLVPRLTTFLWDSRWNHVCTMGRRYVNCWGALSDGDARITKHDAGFTMDTFGTLIVRRGGRQTFIDDSPPIAPVDPYYVPPVTVNPVDWSSVLPDYYDPGGTYGEISPTTGLPRTYYVRPYVRRDGTYVSGYYRSCSRCSLP